MLNSKTSLFFLYLLLAMTAARLSALGIGDANIGKDSFGTVRAAYHPDGGRAAVSLKNGTICIWDIKTRSLLRRFPAHVAGINSLSYSPDGNVILSTGFDGFLRVWDIETAMPSVSHFDPGIFLSAGYNHRGDNIVLASPLTGRLQVLDAANGTSIWSIKESSAISAAFSPDDTLLAAGDEDYGIRLLDAKTGEIIRSFDPAHNDPAGIVAFSPDGSHIVSADNSSVCVWNVERGALVYQLDDIGGFTVSAAFSPDGKRIMTVTDHLICLWDAATGQRLLDLKREDYYGREIGSAVFSPGGESVLVAETSGFIWIYNAETGEPVTIIPPLNDDSE